MANHSTHKPNIQVIFGDDIGMWNLLMGGQAVVAKFLETFEAFPPRQKAASFTIDQAMPAMEDSLTAGR
jgi:hypothetical protein